MDVATVASQLVLFAAQIFETIFQQVAAFVGALLFVLSIIIFFANLFDL